MFLCMQFVHTPFLGNFYADKEIIRDDEIFTETSGATVETFFDYIGETEQLESMSYTYGVAVKIYKDAKLFPDVTSDRNGFLGLPKQILDSCTWSDPVRFLEDYHASCPVVLSESVCTSQPSLNPRFFQSPQKEFFALSPKILSDSKDQNSGLQPKDVKVTYLLKVRQETPTIQIEPNMKYLWPLNRNEENQDFTIEPYTVPFQETLPPPPSFELIGNAFQCKDIVQAVHYELTWNASKIMSIAATVYMGNVNVDKTSNRLDQEFSVQWKHGGAVNTKPEEGYNFRSGNPGYETGKPLIAGDITENGDIVYSNNQIHVLKPAPNGLCQFSSPHNATFREDIDSACFLQLSANSLSDCNDLRNEIFRGLDNVITATHLSKIGTVEIINPENFVIIFRQNVSQYLIEPTSDLSNYTVYKASVNGASMLKECHNIPNRLVLDVFFSEAGRVNGISVFEISGALIFYNFTTWRFTKISHTTQQFPVTFSIRFHQKPAESPPRTKSYYLKERRDHCPSAVTCWNELFFPFLEINIGTEFQYSIVMGAATFFVIIATYAFTKPWWT